MSAALAIGVMKRDRYTQWIPFLLSGLMLSTLSAEAEAPAPSQEFWNYLVEYGDAQGQLFDPSDYATVTSLPAKAQQEIEKNSAAAKPEQVPHESKATQEQSR